MQSEYEISTLYQEARSRWLKPPEVLFILQNHERLTLTNTAPQRPTSGSLFLFNKRVLKFFRKDGHQWRRKRDGRAIAEAHERLKVGNAEALNCYYAHGEQDPTFRRRIYWMLDPEYEHIVLVHYRDVSDREEGQQAGGQVYQFAPIPSTLFLSPNSIGTQNVSYNHYIGDSSDIHQQHSSTSPGIAEVNSNLEGSGSSSEFEQALKMLKEQLSIGDEQVNSVDPLNIQPESLDSLQFLEYSNDRDHLVQPTTIYQRPENNKLERCYGGNFGAQYNAKNDSNKLERCYGGYVGAEYHSSNLMLVKNDSGGTGGSGDQGSESWKDVLEACEASIPLNSEQGSTPSSAKGLLAGLQEDTNWSYNNQVDQSTLLLPQDLGSFEVPVSYSALGALENNDDYCRMMDNEGKIGLPFEEEMRLAGAHKKKFTIHDISPEWGYSNETTKVIIVGSFLCDPTESTWSCMFGNAQVPFEIIKEGVIRCRAPPCGPGKVNLCITSGDGLSCSEIREFEYRDKPDTCCPKCSERQTSDMSTSPDELSILVMFVQTLLSDRPSERKSNLESGNDKLLKILKADDDQWRHVIGAVLDGSASSTKTVDWLLQELLKDKLDTWLSSRSCDEDYTTCSLSKQEQGIIHMVAGLGFEWALYPILGHGVSVDFRDINGWSALHWAARFGSEKMVAALIASGASAGAVTDPSRQDPNGKTAASIAASNGHKGLAGYLSEVALTNHLSSLTLEETESSKDTAQVQTEITLNSISEQSPSGNEDQVSLKDTLAAVRNAAQAAARIQAAFRAHSFRKRKQREAAMAACLQEYGIYCEDIEGISAMSKLTFGKVRNYHLAALSIQKKYRGYKGRKEFLELRQKVVKIQAHVRGYQIRKNYKVICWAVGIIDKVVLRWRRKGVGLRGFRQDVESTEDSEDEDILKVFRKQKVDGAVNEAFSRVLSMANSPEARQQYHRVLKRYCQTKAELGKTETLIGDDDDGLFDIADMEYDTLFTLP
ncbi:calmodulin-binding transcription activator 4 isoform X1 [Arabidopsis lyrata subsp. lyrata]|uniref:calmodulin-binding transcription activator 4 isoform X1 n=1 Tax=Arabidopsis lyrata subsp. lyrata TaxID=81972 RepID=UPI000A29CBE6|nr:calmodulin-binding transcription activator 4 isoform X1 [Arabidopsis lyrata subsp. lyrata]|eukprot:XP_020890717.1 calmodulin-binding transcription activator 4 isoform X1 [Arabidopsis lyrata subsp. lyrata]